MEVARPVRRTDRRNPPAERQPGRSGPIQLDRRRANQHIQPRSTLPLLPPSASRRKFSIVGNADNPDGLIFRRPDGTIIESAAKPTSPDGPLPPSAKPFVHPTGERWLNRDTWFTPDPATQIGRAHV